MKSMMLIPIVALFFGGAVGYLVGQRSAPSEDGESDSQARSARRVPVSESAGRTLNGRSSSRAKSLGAAMAVSGQSARLQTLMDYFATLHPSQFEEEAKKLDDLPWSERMMVGYMLFARWGEEDPTTAMAYTKSMGFMGVFVRGTVMQGWASKFPKDAADYYASNPGEFRMDGMMGRRGGGGSSAGTIAAEWARQDSEGAMAWAQSLEGDSQRDAMRGVFSQMAKEDPAKAADMLSSIIDEASKRQAQNTIAREWGGKDWAAARSWVSTLPASEQDEAMARALRGLAETDPSAAAFHMTALPEGADRDSAVEGITRQWSREDPAATAAWLMKEGSVEAQQQSMRHVMPSWVQTDPAEALQFIHSQPEGGVRDSAVSSYVHANQSGSVQDNLRLAETIGDERTRGRTMGQTIMAWMGEDKEAATEYLNTTESLSDESRNRIRRWTERGRGGRGWRR